MILNLKLVESFMEQQIRFNDNKSLFYNGGKSALGPSPRTLCWLLKYILPSEKGSETYIQADVWKCTWIDHYLNLTAIHREIQFKFCVDNRLIIMGWKADDVGFK